MRLGTTNQNNRRQITTECGREVLLSSHFGSRVLRVSLKERAAAADQDRAVRLVPVPASDKDDGEAAEAAHGRRLTGSLCDGKSPILRLQVSLDGKEIIRDPVFGSFSVVGRDLRHFSSREQGERLYGLGERTGALERSGRRWRNGAVDAMGYDPQRTDPLYKHLPFLMVVRPDNVAYGLLYDDSSYESAFDLGCEIDAFKGPFRYFSTPSGRGLTLYIIAGPTVAEVITGLTVLLTGAPALFPRFAFGYLGSTMAYTESPNASVELERFAQDCETYGMPSTLFHLSSGYTTDSLGRRQVFTWNRAKIPDPHAMVRGFTSRGIHLAANVKPHLLVSHPLFGEALDLGLFAPTSGPALFWSGGRGEFEEGRYLNFTNPAAYRWWKEHVTSALLDFGIDAVWNDNNEFTALENDELRPSMILNMNRASREAVQEKWPAKRPFILTRAGTVGIQALSITWTGDNFSSWETLRWNVPMGLGLSLSGIPNFGHDVGGFAGPAPEEQLLVRWVQQAVWYPRFTIHSWNTDGTVTSPWMYPDGYSLAVNRHFLELRESLVPLLYALHHQSHLDGSPPLRPLLYHFLADPRAANDSFRFMLGPDLLISPVLDRDVEELEVYLPSDHRWALVPLGLDERLDPPCEEIAQGGATLLWRAGPGDICVHLREGGILTLADRSDPSCLIAIAFPRPGSTTLRTCVEDDGVTVAHDPSYSASDLSLTMDATAAAGGGGQVTLNSTITKRATAPSPFATRLQKVVWLLPSSVQAKGKALTPQPTLPRDLAKQSHRWTSWSAFSQTIH
jgi:alpha-glucosidase (family GH31 glycosyl hydrolase)